MRCTPEEKQHMLDLVAEMKAYETDIVTKKDLSYSERAKIVTRMTTIVKEMKEFRRMYPDD